MLKVKIAVTVAMTLIAAGAMASNFRGADQVYVPAAGHLGGSTGTFISDVFIANLSSDAVSVSVIYSALGAGQQNFNNILHLAANERRDISDFFPTVLNLQSGFGQLIFNACKEGGNCDTSTCPGGSSGVCPDFRNISVESRIYQILSNCAGTYSAAVCAAAGTSAATQPTTGQLFSGLPWYSFTSSDAAAVGLDKVQITGFRNTGGAGQAGTYRSNVGLVNASQYSTTTLVVRLFDGATNNPIGNPAQVTLGPLGVSQSGIAALFPSFTGTAGKNAYITVEQTNTSPTGDAAAAGCGNGCPAFFAYGSVLDNVSGDATTLEPQYLKPLTDAAVNCIYNQVCKGSFNPKRAVKH